MIPLAIKLSNFGAIQEAGIDLRDISLAAVVGPNGVGKSTLFTTAPMWALFGAGRSNGSDDVVRTGETSCSVAFDFEHQGQEYRVVRTRSISGRGKSSLELLRATPEGLYESLSGTTIRETEEKIQALLHLDAETFAASSMILQGRANEFTAKAPGQRKAILTQILGLEVYDRLQEGAKRHFVESQRSLDRLQGDIETFRARLDELPDVEQKLECRETELLGLESLVLDLDKKIKETRQELFRAEEDCKKADEMRTRNEELRQRIRSLEERCERCGETVREADGIIAEEEQILSAAREYEDTKDRLTVLREKAPRLEQVRTRYRELKNEYDGLLAEKEKCMKEIHAIESTLAERPRIEAAAQEVGDLVGRIAEADKAAECVLALEKERSAIQAKIDENRSARTLLGQQIKSCEEKVDRLERSGCVALGQAEMSPCRFLQDAVEAKNSLPGLRGKLEALEDITPLNGRWKEILEKVISLEKITDQAADEWRPRLLQIRPLAEQLNTLKSKEELLNIHLRRQKEIDDRSATLIASMKEVSVEGKHLLEELEPMETLEKLLKELAVQNARKDELAAARERRRGALEQFLALEEEIDEAGARLKECVYELDHFEIEMVEIVEQRLQELESDLADMRCSMTSIHPEIGALRAKLAELEDIKLKNEKLQQEKGPLVRNNLRWDELVRAFGRNGIPAFIIENAIPELERIANEILGQMSNGRHMLRFETQRDLKSKSGVAETLDIIVSDWQGARPYETFSGGETLRIDLAIRIGLAELLAVRSGNKIEWLVVDEGIGSQDDEHRETVLRAIQNVAPRFRRTMVITHIKEAQGIFPQVIDLSRNEDKLEVHAS
jgi:exonuclease SbcC